MYGEELGRYAFPDPHPFGSRRLHAFWRELTARGLDRQARIVPPETCDWQTLEVFHDREYLEFVRAASERGTGLLDAGDTPALPGIFEAASIVVGTTLAAVRLVATGQCKRAFNPVGGLHHARRDRAGGFCVFNDVGVSIRILRERHGIQRIGYVDIDAHHGDGVYYGFASDPDVVIGDIHEDGRFLYPGTGSADEVGTSAARGTKLNIPLPPGADERAFLEAFDRVEAFVDASAPQFLLLQCGADGLAGDPLTDLMYTPRCHRHAAERLRSLADEHCGGKLVAMGGGGYAPKHLANAWCEVVDALV